MNRMYAPYMRYGAKVKDGSGKVFTLVEDMSAEKETVAGVESNLYGGQYRILKAWIKNWKSGDSNFKRYSVDDVKAWEAEVAAMVVPLTISEVEPEDKIRFIASDYDTRFVVPNLGLIRMNGEARQVFAYDECHFGFIQRDYTEKPDGKNHSASCYHICEFAERCEVGMITVEPME